MKFGFVIPNCMEGLNLPPAFAGPSDLVKLARTAESLGLYSLWTNDHVVPWPQLSQAWGGPLNWYDILITTAYCAGVTNKIKLGLGVVVVPFRDPVLLAKQVATLDVFSGGRVFFGSGIGTVREELELLFPRFARANRGEMQDEMLEALELLWSGSEASFRGKYYAFEKVSLNPKPLQDPLPVYASGQVPQTLDRVARHGAGLMVMGAPAPAMRDRIDGLRAALDKVDRDISEIDVAVSLVMSLAPTREQAMERFLNTQVGRRFTSRPGATIDRIVEGNLIGTPEEVAERVRGLAMAGMTHCAPQHIAAESFEEMMEQMHIYAEELIPLC